MDPRRRLVACAILLLGGAGCRVADSEPLARLSIAPAAVVLTHPGTARLEATWEPTLVLPADLGPLQVFVHLVGRPGEVLRTFDHPLALDWRIGERQVAAIELWQSALDPPLPSGTYDLTAGLYDPRTGRRLPLAVSGEAVDRFEYRVARVEVPAAEDRVQVSFTGGWLPPEASADRQVLTRRWLADSGEIVLEGLPGPVELTLAFRLPDLPADPRSLVFDAGQSVPALRVEADCSDQRAEASGPGLHRVSLRLEAGTGCKVRLDPSFFHQDPSSLTRRSVLLEVLAWDPAEGRSAVLP